MIKILGIVGINKNPNKGKNVFENKVCGGYGSSVIENFVTKNLN